MKYWMVLLCSIVVINVGRMVVDACCTGFLCECGELVSSSTYLFLGEYLNMTCKLKQTAIEMGYNSSQLFITYGEGIRVTEEETFVIDSSSLGINRLITTVPDTANGLSKHYCKLEKVHTIVGSASIELEYPPQPVTNMSCIIYNWDERMICTWDLGVKYKNMKHINISLSMDDGYCPSLHTTNCTWTIKDGVEFDRSPLNFTVSVINIKRGVLKHNRKFIANHYDYVKPEKVDYFNVISTNSTCVTLAWSHSKKDREKIFIISLTSKWNDEKEHDTSATNMTVCDLKPYTSYNITIVTRPGNSIGYPSDPVVNYTLTDIDRPSSSPEILGNTYSEDSKDCINNKRTVTVSWKAIPPEDENGPLLGYFLAVSYRTGKITEYHINNTSQFFKTLTIPCDQKVTLSLKAWGKAGYSLTSSMIVIPEASYLSRSEIAAIIVGAILVFIFLTVATVFCLRKSISKIKEMKLPLQIDTIDVPKTDKNMVNGSCSKDSGTYSSEPSSMESYQFLIHREQSSNQYSILSHEVSPEMSNSVTNTLQSQSNAAFERTSSLEEDSPASLVDSCSDGSETFDHSCNMFASDVSVCSEKFVVDDEEDEDGYRGGNSYTSSYDDAVVSYVVQENEDSSSSESTQVSNSNSEVTSHKDCSHTLTRKENVLTKEETADPSSIQLNQKTKIIDSKKHDPTTRMVHEVV